MFLSPVKQAENCPDTRSWWRWPARPRVEDPVCRCTVRARACSGLSCCCTTMHNRVQPRHRPRIDTRPCQRRPCRAWWGWDTVKTRRRQVRVAVPLILALAVLLALPCPPTGLPPLSCRHLAPDLAFAITSICPLVVGIFRKGSIKTKNQERDFLVFSCDSFNLPLHSHPHLVFH